MDIDTGQVRKTLLGHSNYVKMIDIAQDESTLVSAGMLFGTAKIWNLQGHQRTGTPDAHSGNVSFVSISKNEKTLYSASSFHEIMVRDASTGRVSQIIPTPSVSYRGTVTINNEALVVPTIKNELTIFDLTERKQETILTGHSDDITGLTVSADGRIVVSASKDHTVKYWDKWTGELLRSFPTENSIVGSLLLSADKSTILGACDDKTIKFFDAQTGELLREVKCDSPDGSLAWSSDARSIITNAFEGGFAILDFQTGAIQKRFGRNSNLFAVSPEQQLLAVRDFGYTIQVWDLQTCELLTQFECDDFISTLAISNNTIVANGHAGEIHVFDLVTAQSEE